MKRRLSVLVGLIVAAAIGQMSTAVRADEFARDRRYGYVASPSEEQALAVPDAIALPDLHVDEEKQLKDRLFNDQLTKEFRQHYQEQFGRTGAEQQISLYSNPTATYQNDQGTYISAVDQNNAQRAFGNYMMARMFEYHLDNWAKNDQSTKGVYDMKEKLSKFNAEVAPGVSFMTNYSISEGALDSEFKNPWVHTRVRYLMPMQETYLQMDRPLTPTIGIANYVALRDGTVKLVGSKALTKILTTTLTLGTYFNSTGYSVRESLVIAGFGWSI